MSENIEIWKDIEKFEGKYMVSNIGNVKSLKRFGIKKDRLLKPYPNIGGYLMVNLYQNGKMHSYLVARLVALAFLEPVDGCLSVDHINRIKTDNRVENLRFANSFIQSANRDWVINSKHFLIYYCKNISRWRVQFRYSGFNKKQISFLTRELAVEFAETIDKTQLIPIDDPRTVEKSILLSQRIACDVCGSIIAKNGLQRHQKKSKKCLSFLANP